MTETKREMIERGREIEEDSVREREIERDREREGGYSGRKSRDR